MKCSRKRYNKSDRKRYNRKITYRDMKWNQWIKRQRRQSDNERHIEVHNKVMQSLSGSMVVF